MIKQTPAEVKQLIDRYFHLNVGGKSVPTPYYRNKDRVRGELRALVGKGSPDEIEDEVKIYAKLRGVDLNNLSVTEIRDFMRKEAIGVDCSGYVSHILSTWVKIKGHQSLYKLIKTPPMGIFKRFLFKMRTIENLGSDLLTSGLNCTKIKVAQVQPGDLLRLKGIKQGSHVAIVIDVKRQGEEVKEITYTHSYEHYAPKDGVRIGKIRITDQTKSLKHQDWLEVDKNGVCWIYKGYLTQWRDNGLRRLKFHKLLNV